jgi:hypothetical protein
MDSTGKRILMKIKQKKNLCSKTATYTVLHLDVAEYYFHPLDVPLI